MQIKLLILSLVITAQISALDISDTPLLDPNMDANQLGLAKIAISKQGIYNLNYNPAAIMGTKGISIYGTNHLDIDYSSFTFVNEYKSILYGIQYTNSSIDTVARSYVENSTELNELDSIVAYEYYSLSLATAF